MFALSGLRLPANPACQSQKRPLDRAGGTIARSAAVEVKASQETPRSTFVDDDPELAPPGTGSKRNRPMVGSTMELLGMRTDLSFRTAFSLADAFPRLFGMGAFRLPPRRRSFGGLLQSSRFQA